MCALYRRLRTTYPLLLLKAEVVAILAFNADDTVVIPDVLVITGELLARVRGERRLASATKISATSSFSDGNGVRQSLVKVVRRKVASIVDDEFGFAEAGELLLFNRMDSCGC